ncbi:hypothetical protein ABT160_19090 [Streptomyces sp. NPDC001941]|uniref:hypothetical protein n=1 Tax=Streptomyces sp. NPDC001941 TaxID=3154659 RepID=UPI003325A8F5
MASTTIQVSRETRDHLAALAGERGLTLGQLVQQLAEQQPTAEQRAARLAEARRHVREVIGLDIPDEEFEGAPDILGNIYRAAAAKVAVARGEAA